MHTLFPGIADKAGMLLCTAGSRELIIGERLYRIRQGTLCFFSPIIYMYELSRSDDYVDLTISDDVKTFYPIIRSNYDLVLQLRLLNHPCMQLDEEECQFFLRQRERIGKLEQESTGELREKAERRRLLTQLIQTIKQETLLSFIHCYCRIQAIDPVPVGKEKALTFRFLYLLHKNWHCRHSVSHYADALHLSRSHFTRVIKQETGKAPSEWIAAILLLNAKLLLTMPDRTIKEVAATLGFPEQFTFRKFFKTHTGLSPTAYRTSGTTAGRGQAPQ